MAFLINKKRKLLIWIASVTLTLAIIVGACVIYVNDYYRADHDAIAAFVTKNEPSYTVMDGKMAVYEPKDATAGIIFYPGGKVEYTAYLPLMESLASEGILTVIVEMPCNLAVLDVNAADGIKERFPEIKEWYVGGHSLGGSMAATYAAKHHEELEGVLLLGSYSTSDLTDKGLEVLSIYGSEDKVLNKDKYDKYRSNLPKDLTEVVIEGGCHAYFGMYGAQKGDGVPTLTNEEQIRITADAIAKIIKGTDSQ